MRIILPVILLLGTRLAVMAQSDLLGNPPDGSSFPFLKSVSVGQTYNPAIPGVLDNGTAIGFTPLQNIDLTTVTIWLNDYTGANGMSINCSIYNDTADLGFNNGGPTSPVTPGAPLGPIGQLTGPAPNAGILAPYTFTGNIQLTANMAYYIYLSGTDNPGTSFKVNLVSSPIPSSSEALYNGVDNWDILTGQSLSYQGLDNSYSPAFEINPVPEPASWAIFGAALLGLKLIRKRQAAA